MRLCCIGDHRMRWWQRAPQWGDQICRRHYWAGFFPPADPACIEAIMSAPNPAVEGARIGSPEGGDDAR